MAHLHLPQDIPPAVQAILNEQPMNKKCFECGHAPVTWCSVSLGIFLCLNCAGDHRALGTHLSFVRSLTLDDLSAKQLLFLQLGGNRRARDHFEEGLSDVPLGDMSRWRTAKGETWRQRLKQQVAQALGEPLEEPSLQPTQVKLSAQMEKYRGATSIGSTDMFGEKKPKKTGCCGDCCTLL